MPVLIINGQNVTTYRAGGAGEYTKQLYQRLKINDSLNELGECRIELINFNDNERQMVHTENIPKTPFSPLKECAKKLLPTVPFNTLCRVYEALYWKEEKQKISDAAPLSWECGNRVVLHELTNYNACKELARICLSSNSRLLVSFLDVQDFFSPENFSDEILTRRRLYYNFYKDRGDMFLAISEFTKKTMIEKLNIDESKIIVTYLATNIDQEVRPSQDAVEWAQVFGRYLIYPAKLWPHKNHAFLLRVIARCKDKFKKASFKLILTGGLSPADVTRIGDLIQQNGIQDLVHVLGFQTKDRLNALISNAEYLIFPSLFEGFGMPILEAMSHGCPVMTSTSTSLPEIGGDAAIYFDPRDDDSLISLLDDMFRGVIDRQSYIEKGYINCKRFNWEKTYSQTIMVYRELLS